MESFDICHALSFSEWLTVMATHAIFGKGLEEWSVNRLHLRICLLAHDGGLPRTNYNGKVFKKFKGTSGASWSMVSKKSNSHISYNKLSEGSPDHLAVVTGDPKRMLTK